jgi:carbon monoxide dehydrogenase subunit G
MHFEGTVPIQAPRERVWQFLTDPDQVGSCGPGVESVEVTDPTHFRARAKVGIGSIVARFVIDLELTELNEPTSATISARGQAPGTAVDAVGRMHLREGDDDGGDGGATTMDWAADVDLSGKLASVGTRIIEWTAQKLITQTFECIKIRLEG